MTKLNQLIFKLLFSLQAAKLKHSCPLCFANEHGGVSGVCVCVCVKSACRRSNLRQRRSNQVLVHMFLVSAPRFPQRAGRLIVSLVIGGPGKGHD